MAPAPKMVRTKTPGVFKRGLRYVVVFRDAARKQRKEAARIYDDARRLKNKREAESAAVSSRRFTASPSTGTPRSGLRRTPAPARTASATGPAPTTAAT
jgi:hypothetical protein